MTFEDRENPEWIKAIQEERRAAVARFNERRTIEWRVAFSLWAAFGLVANAVRFVDFTTCGRALATVAALAVVLMHAVWVAVFMERAAPDNWQEGVDLTNLVRRQLGLGEDDVIRPRAEQSRFGYWWQVAMTLLIALFVIMFIWQGA